MSGSGVSRTNTSIKSGPITLLGILLHLSKKYIATRDIFVPIVQYIVYFILIAISIGNSEVVC